VVHQIANNFFFALVVSQWRRTPFLNTWITGIREFFGPNLLSIPTAYVLATLYERIHFTIILAYLMLLPLQWSWLRLYLRKRQLHAQIVDGLVVATDVNFPLGRGHARRVADLAVTIAREMRLGEAAVESVQFAALLHDVGMIGKDDLLDRSALTPEDTEGLRDHVRVGAEIARELPRNEIADAILRHHERYDGTGYPGGLSGDRIPLIARIIAVAEVVDSMASGAFPYVSASTPDGIVAHVTAERGRAFDPDVVDALLRVMEQRSEILAPEGEALHGAAVHAQVR
jgi:putative nucleotidyltransferase with HDIG domain